VAGYGGFEPKLDGGFCEIGHCGRRLVCSSLLVYGACVIVRLGIILEYLCWYLLLEERTVLCSGEIHF